MYAEHFPLENVRQNAFCRFLTFCKQNVRVASNAFVTFCVTKCTHQMHFCTASNAFVTFCFAEHFPLENVMLNILQSKMYALRCKNAFLHQMHFCIKCIFASNAFLHQMHFCKTKCTHQMHFCTNKMYASNAFLHSVAEHFPLENVQQNKMYASNAFDAKMHFCNAQPLFFAKQKTQHFAAF